MTTFWVFNIGLVKNITFL